MSTAWTPVTSAELAGLVGLIGRVQQVELTAERREGLRRSAGRPDPARTRTDLADFCPDPLVLALESGLPRPASLGVAIDGGSEWEQHAALTPGVLTAVSRIVAVVERTSSAGRRMRRTCYQTEFHDQYGAHVGTARGFGLDIARSGEGGAA